MTDSAPARDDRPDDCQHSATSDVHRSAPARDDLAALRAEIAAMPTSSTVWTGDPLVYHAAVLAIVDRFVLGRAAPSSVQGEGPSAAGSDPELAAALDKFAAGGVPKRLAEYATNPDDPLHADIQELLTAFHAALPARSDAGLRTALDDAIEGLLGTPRPPAGPVPAADIAAWELAAQRLRIAYRAYRGEVTMCPIPSSVTGQSCLLAEGHIADSPDRFHRYAAADHDTPPDRTFRSLRRRWNVMHDRDMNEGIYPADHDTRAGTGLDERLLDAANTALRQWHGFSNSAREGEPLETADDEEAVLYRETRQTVRDAIREQFAAVATPASPGDRDAK